MHDAALLGSLETKLQEQAVDRLPVHAN